MPTNLQILPAPVPASWAEAKRLVEKIRSGARAWLQLGEVLEALRTQFFAERAGAGRPSDWEKANVKRIAPHDAAQIPSDRGWQAKVREELGISDDTARRWMLDARRYGQLLQITDGTVTEVEGHKVTAKARDAAKAALDEMAGDPTVRPARKWAGVWSSVTTKGSQRKGCDHVRNIERGLTALATSLDHWTELPAERRFRIESAWAEIVEAGLIPSTWRRL